MNEENLLATKGIKVSVILLLLFDMLISPSFPDEVECVIPTPYYFTMLLTSCNRLIVTSCSRAVVLSCPRPNSPEG